MDPIYSDFNIFLVWAFKVGTIQFQFPDYFTLKALAFLFKLQMFRIGHSSVKNRPEKKPSFVASHLMIVFLIERSIQFQCSVLFVWGFCFVKCFPSSLFKELVLFGVDDTLFYFI